jgi:sirohydrochlorin cobaltochelatase
LDICGSFFRSQQAHGAATAAKFSSLFEKRFFFYTKQWTIRYYQLKVRLAPPLSTDRVMTDYIILTAFGTTTRAKDTYNYLEKRIAPRFPSCRIRWAFSSPTVRRNSASADAPPALSEVVQRLKDPGRIVIQSLHVLPGHEFDRVVNEAKTLPVAAALGLPLLHGPADFTRVAGALKSLILRAGHGAALVLGHGTDHPCRASYAALHRELQKQIGPQVFFSTIEKAVDPPESVIRKIYDAGYREVFCIPLLMVAGMHFLRDINGDQRSSWRSLLQEQQIDFHLHDRGLAYLEGVDELFCDHIQAAFDSMTA